MAIILDEKSILVSPNHDEDPIRVIQVVPKIGSRSGTPRY